MLRIEIINVCFTLMFVFISCKKENTIEPKTEPHSPYTIKYGETLTLPSLDLKIGFCEILEDSRCPIGVMCFWQGRARINVRIVTSVTDTITIALMIYGNSSKEDTIHHIPTDTLGYRITLQQLDPYPVFGDTTHTITDYTALISIIRKQENTL